MYSIYYKIERHLSDEVKDALFPSTDKLELSIPISKGLNIKTRLLYLTVNCRNDFDLNDATFELVKNLNLLGKMDCLKNLYDNKLFMVSKNYNHYELSTVVHIRSDKIIDIQNLLYGKYQFGPTYMIPFHNGVNTNECVCGVEVVYVDKATTRMHSEWCPKSRLK